MSDEFTSMRVSLRCLMTIEDSQITNSKKGTTKRNVPNKPEPVQFCSSLRDLLKITDTFIISSTMGILSHVFCFLAFLNQYQVRGEVNFKGIYVDESLVNASLTLSLG